MPTAASVIADMKGNDRSLPGSNPGAGWSRGGFITMGGDWRGQATPIWWNANNKYFGYWNSVLPWFVVWDGDGHVAGLNTRLWIKRIETQVLRGDGVWQILQDTTAIGGESFSRNLINSSGGVDERSEPGGGRSVILTPASGPVFHGWSTFSNWNGNDVRGVHHRVTFQLIKNDPNGVDDRYRAVYCVEAGADAYVYSGQSVNDFSPTGYNPGIGASKFKLASATEQVVCMTTLNSALEVETSSNGGKNSYFVMSEAAFLANLPNGVTLTGTVSSPPAANPPPAPPPSATTKYIMPLGDSFTKGAEGVSNGYRSPRGRVYQKLTAQGRLVDMVGPQADTPAIGGDPHHAGYGGAYLGPGTNGGNNLPDKVSDFLPTSRYVDLFMVWAGWNSVYNESDPGGKFEAFINTLKTARPGAKFVLGTLPPTQGETQAQTNAGTPGYQSLNTKIRALCSADPTRLYLADTASLTYVSGDYWDVIHLFQSGVDKAEPLFTSAITAALYGGSAPSPSPTPTPVPPPAPVGRREIWFSGSTGGSTQEGSNANPINSLTTLRAAIQTYGPTGIDLRMKAGGVWTGVFPEEAFQYVGTTIKGDDWLSSLGHFEGGVRKTDWVTQTGAPGGKQLWKCTTLKNESPTTSVLQAGCVSIDDAIIANRRFTTLAPTITLMDAFALSYSYDSTNNVMYLLLTTGIDPNISLTMVAQTASCMSNGNFSFQGNKRTGLVMQHLRFKRYSAFPVSLSNLPGIQIKNVYGKHIGGRHRPTSEGKLIELYGGCDSFIVEDIKGEGIEGSVFSTQVRPGWPVQSPGTVRRITGTHIGVSAVELSVQMADTGVLDGMVIEDVSATRIGGFKSDGMRPDTGGVGLVYAYAPFGAGTSSINNLTVRRAQATDCPVGSVDLGYATTGRSMFFEGCQGIADPALSIEAGIKFGHQVSGTGSDVFVFRACAFKGYQRGIKHQGGLHSFGVEVTNCGFDTMSVAAIDMNGVPNTVLTVQNNVAHSSVLMVKAINGAGSSLVNNGGSYVSTGTALGYTAAGSDTTGGANPGFVGSSAAKPPSGSALYSGGTALGITLVDRLGQTFISPWAQSAYAQYTATDGSVSGGSSSGSGTGVDSVWENKLTTLGDVAWIATQSGASFITGLTGVDTTKSLIIGEAFLFSPTVTGTGAYSSAVSYTLQSGTAVTVSSNGSVKAVAVGTAVVRTASTQTPTVFVNTTFTVLNFSEYPISANPLSLALTMIGGPVKVTIRANGNTQAGISALSANSLVAVADEKTAADGTLTITPVAIGNCTILVTKVSRFGGNQTIQIPVTVTAGTAAGDITAIDTSGNHVIYINQSPYFIPLKDQNGDPIVGFATPVLVRVSLPGYVAAPHTIIDGTLPVYPVGVGIASVALELHDTVAGKVRKTFTIEVLPIGGSATPAPAPPPPISPPNPDPVVTPGDFVFEVTSE